MNEIVTFIKEVGFPAFAFIAMLALFVQASKERRTIIQNNTDAINRLTNMISEGRK